MRTSTTRLQEPKPLCFVTLRPRIAQLETNIPFVLATCSRRFPAWDPSQTASLWPSFLKFPSLSDYRTHSKTMFTQGWHSTTQPLRTTTKISLATKCPTCKSAGLSHSLMDRRPRLPSRRSSKRDGFLQLTPISNTLSLMSQTHLK